MAAFVILLHAECEHFLEKRALKVADEAKAAFDSGGDFGRVARHLCVFPFIDAPKQMSDLEKMGTVRNFVCGEAVDHQAVMALMKRSPKSTANCAFAMFHSRGGIFHSFSDRFKIR